MFARYVVTMIACCTLTMAGCGGSQRPDASSSNSAPGVSEGLARAFDLTERTVALASNDFGLVLTTRVAAADTRANIVLSPLSASMALGMALNGADGATLDAMRSGLGFGSLTIEQINGAYRTLLKSLRHRDPAVRFEIANALWTNDGIPFHEAFLQTIDHTFEAQAQSRDFGSPATLAAINTWVKQKTGGRIERIVDTLDPALSALLVNAIHFEGAWTTQFDPAKTQRATFTREDGSTVDVDMMSMDRAELRRAYNAAYAAVELPYGNGAFSMIVVLPDPGVTARAWLSQLDGEQWAALLDELAVGRIDRLSIPKVRLTYDAYLNDALKQMGMGAAFRPGADFSRMSPAGEQMCIDFVRQRTFVEMDERGTRAAAATGVGMGLVSFTELVFDRPFVFFIREQDSGALLFVGLVTDPTAQGTPPEQLVSSCTSMPSE
ncbi:MAG: serpin family protein [Gammaproteobacteria bacterium]